MVYAAVGWFRERPLASAILVSLAIHATALTLFPQLRALKTELPTPLNVDILEPPQEALQSPELPRASEPLPQVKAPPAPPPDRPRPKLAKAPPMAVRQPAPTAAAPAVPQPELITATPEAPASPSQFSVPAAPVRSDTPVPPHETEAAPDPDLLAGYGHALSQAIGRQQRYPRLAQMRGWEGTATVALKFGAGHKFLSATVQKSSGHQILDEQALEMVKDAHPLPRPPESLRSRDFTVLVPIVFRLKE
ncbi:MAG: TonB family protein [Burkholderiales bacterium]